MIFDKQTRTFTHTRMHVRAHTRSHASTHIFRQDAKNERVHVRKPDVYIGYHGNIADVVVTLVTEISIVI